MAIVALRMSTPIHPEAGKAAFWAAIVLAALGLLGVCAAINDDFDVTVEVQVFQEPLPASAQVTLSGAQGIAGYSASFTESGEQLFQNLDKEQNYALSTNLPPGCQQVGAFAGITEDKMEDPGDSFARVLVVCGSYGAEFVVRLVFTNAVMADAAVDFTAEYDYDDPNIFSDNIEATVTPGSPFELAVDPGELVTLDVIGRGPVEPLPRPLPGTATQPCHIVSPGSYGRFPVANGETITIDIEVWCADQDGAAPATTSTTTTTTTSTTTTTQAPAKSVVAGDWLFQIDVQDVTGEQCRGEQGKSYEREITITGPDHDLMVAGFDNLEDPDDPAWQGSYRNGLLVFGGSRDEDDGTTMATFEMSLSADGRTLAGEEFWTWDRKGETGTCTDGNSTVEAQRISG